MVLNMIILVPIPKEGNSGFLLLQYITFAPIGFDWKPNSWFKSFWISRVVWQVDHCSNDPIANASPTGYFKGNKETPLATLYGVDTIRKVRGEFGAFVTATMIRHHEKCSLL
jgi:hypothetical protein